MTFCIEFIATWLTKSVVCTNSNFISGNSAPDTFVFKEGVEDQEEKEWKDEKEKKGKEKNAKLLLIQPDVWPFRYDKQRELISPLKDVTWTQQQRPESPTQQLDSPNWVVCDWVNTRHGSYWNSTKIPTWDASSATSFRNKTNLGRRPSLVLHTENVKAFIQSLRTPKWSFFFVFLFSLSTSASNPHVQWLIIACSAFRLTESVQFFVCGADRPYQLQPGCSDAETAHCL